MIRRWERGSVVFPSIVLRSPRSFHEPFAPVFHGLSRHVAHIFSSLAHGISNSSEACFTDSPKSTNSSSARAANPCMKACTVLFLGAPDFLMTGTNSSDWRPLARSTIAAFSRIRGARWPPSRRIGIVRKQVNNSLSIYSVDVSLSGRSLFAAPIRSSSEAQRIAAIKSAKSSANSLGAGISRKAASRHFFISSGSGSGTPSSSNCMSLFPSYRTVVLYRPTAFSCRIPCRVELPTVHETHLKSMVVTCNTCNMKKPLWVGGTGY